MCVSTAPHSPLLYFLEVWECKCTVPIVPIDLDCLHVAPLSPHISPNLPALHPRTPLWCSGRDWKKLIHFWPVNTKLTITGDNWSVWGSVPMVHAHYHNVSDADKKKKSFRYLRTWCSEKLSPSDVGSGAFYLSFKQNLNGIMKEASCFLFFLAAGRREAGEENWRRVCLQSEGRTRWEGGNLDCGREKRKRFCQHWLR